MTRAGLPPDRGQASYALDDMAEVAVITGTSRENLLATATS